MKRFNLWALCSVFMAGMFYSILYRSIPECITEPRTIWDALKVAFVIVVIWAFGYLSKPKNH